MQGGRINFLYPVNTRLDLLEQQKANVNGTLGTFFQGGEFRATASYRFDVDAGGMSAIEGDSVQLSGKRCLYPEDPPILSWKKHQTVDNLIHLKE